jgi:hypothetical protein
MLDGLTELQIVCPDVEPDQCRATPGEIARVRRQLDEEFEDMQPGDGEEPRAVAQLRVLTGGLETAIKLVTWRARNGRLCTELDAGFRDEVDFPASYGPFGACSVRSQCRDLCLEEGSVGVGLKRGEVHLLGGTVSANGDELRIVLVDGKRLRYATRGPEVPGFPGQRVFMVDLGGRQYRGLELVAEGRVVATQKVRNDALGWLIYEEE